MEISATAIKMAVCCLRGVWVQWRRTESVSLRIAFRDDVVMLGFRWPLLKAKSGTREDDDEICPVL
jgi:hypothetical protein